MAQEPPNDNALDATEPTPIAQLSPNLSDLGSRIVDGVVTITWPYSIITKSVAFIVAEPDFRLRNAKGQIRVEFHGAAGQKLSKASIGGGDEIRISLAGAKWEPHQAQTRLAGTMVEWQIKYESTLRMRIRRADSQEVEVITVDSSTEEDVPTTTEVPDVPSPVDISNIIAPGYEAMTPRPKSPPRTLPAKRPASSTLERNEYASPAYLKRARVSYGSLFEDGLDIFDEQQTKKQKKTKRIRFSMGATGWRYSSKSPSPVPDESLEIGSQEAGSSDEERPQQQSNEASLAPTPKIPMVDEGCQTQDLDFSPSMAVQVSVEARSSGPMHLSSPTPIGEPAAHLPPMNAAITHTETHTSAPPTEQGLGFRFDALPSNPLDTSRNLFGEPSSTPFAAPTFSTDTPAPSHDELHAEGGQMGSTFPFQSTNALPFGSHHPTILNPFQPTEEPGLSSTNNHWQPAVSSEQPSQAFASQTHQPVEILDSPPLTKASPPVTSRFGEQGWSAQEHNQTSPTPAEEHEGIDEDGEGESEPSGAQLPRSHFEVPEHHYKLNDQDESEVEDEPEGEYDEMGSEDASRAESEEEGGADEDHHEPTDYELRERERLRRLRDGEEYEEDEEDYEDYNEEDDEEPLEGEYYDSEEEEEEYESEEEPPSRPPPQPKSEPVFISLLSDSEVDAPAAAPKPAPAPAPKSASPPKEAPPVKQEESEEEGEEEADFHDAENDQYNMEDASASERMSGEENAKGDGLDEEEEEEEEVEEEGEEEDEMQAENSDREERDDDVMMESVAEPEEEPEDVGSEPEELPHVVPDRMEVDNDPVKESARTVQDFEKPESKNEAAEGLEGQGVDEDADEVMSQVEMTGVAEGPADETDEEKVHEGAKEAPTTTAEQDETLPEDYEAPVTRSHDAVDTSEDQEPQPTDSYEPPLTRGQDAFVVVDKEEKKGEQDYEPPATRSGDEPAETTEVGGSKPPTTQSNDIPAQTTEVEENYEPPVTRSQDSPVEAAEVEDTYEPPVTRSQDTPAEAMEVEEGYEPPVTRSQDTPASETGQVQPEQGADRTSSTLQGKQTDAEPAASPRAKSEKQQSPTKTETEQASGEQDEDDLAAEEQLMGDFLQTQSSKQSSQQQKAHHRKPSDTELEPPRTRSQSKMEERETPVETTEPEFTITASSLRSHRKSRSISAATGEQEQQRDPSLALARHTEEEAAESQKPAEEEAASRPIRVTRGKADHADPSLALAKVPEDSSQASSSSRPTLRVTRSMAEDVNDENKESAVHEEESQEREKHSLRSTRRTASPETAATPTPSTPSLRRRPAETPVSPASAVKSSSVAESTTADNDNTTATALKLQLQKDLRKTLPDNLALKSLRNSLNKTADVMATVATTPSQPYRPKNGPRDYMLEVLLTDPSSAPTGVHVAHIFRPHAASLPSVHAGDVLLLRSVHVVSVKDRGFGVRVGDASGWAVFEKGDEEMLPQIKGPPVEVTDEEVQYAEGLRRWWALLDGKAMEKMGRACSKLSAN